MPRVTAHPPPHAVARLQAERLARATRPFLARGGPPADRCPGCRLRPSHCLCAWRPQLTSATAGSAPGPGFCLLMADTEPLKPSNTGWLVADLVPPTWAFGWARTRTDPGLSALLADPQWQPLLVFPQDYVAPQRVVQAVPPAPAGRRPLFVLLDGTWSEARKMARMTPLLDALPVLHLPPAADDAPYQLRRARRSDQFCTSAVAARCLALAGAPHAARLLQAWQAVFTHHHLQARHQRPPDLQGPAHRQLQALQGAAGRGAVSGAGR